MAMPGCGPSLYLPDDVYPEGYDVEENGIPQHRIIIERDIWEDDDEKAVDILTDPKEYRPNNPKYRRTDQSDRYRYNEFETNLKMKFFQSSKQRANLSMLSMISMPPTNFVQKWLSGLMSTSKDPMPNRTQS